MTWLTSLFIVIQVLSALAIIILVLVQHGKGADMGAAFGSGASGSLFGASGAANFLSRSTAVMAAIFFIATLVLAYASTNLRAGHAGGGLISNEGAKSAPSPAPATGTAPAGAPATPAPGAEVPSGKSDAKPAPDTTPPAADKNAAPGSSEVPK